MSAAPEPSTIDARYRLDRAAFRLDVDVSIPATGITGIYGRSGSGKTSLLRCIAGLEPSAYGKLTVGTSVWDDADAAVSVPPQARGVGYVFQEPRLFPHLNVRGNLDYAAKRRVPGGATIDEGTVIDLLGIGHLLDRSVGDLSGGEAQRVAIARALNRAPELLLMDEPLASLDRLRREDVMPFLDRLHAELALPILYVSHSIEEVSRLCDHLVVLEQGSVVASGELQAVMTHPEVTRLQGDDAGCVIAATVAAHEDDDITRLEFSGGDLRVAGRVGQAGDDLRVRIRAADVSLCRDMPEGSSILNILPAEVRRITDGEGGVAWALLCLGGDEVLARITRRSARQLSLREGERVFAQIKSVAIRNTPAAGHLDREKIL